MLYGTTTTAIAQRERGLLEKPTRNAKARDIKRAVFRLYTPVAIDEQGRVTIPLDLRKVFGDSVPGMEITILGAGDHFEIWPTKTWNAYAKQLGQ